MTIEAATPMDRGRWDRVSPLLDEALELDAAARVAWLDALARREPDLAAIVRRVLAREATPAATVVAGGFDLRLKDALHDEAPPLAGRRFGAWRLERKIGEGGMGQVWLAQRADGLYVASAAIKLLRSDLQRSSHSARFERERAALARLNDPGIARLLDAGVVDGLTYLVLEYVDGRPLADHVAAACPTVASRVRLLIRIAEAVGHAHALLIVHRDLKPTNVMVTADGTPKLLDFGIAALLDDDDGPSALTRQAGRGLTLGYAAPEQITGAAIGVGADVFSLGVMLYELLAGVLPFPTDGVSRLAVEHAVLHAEPRRLGTLPPQPGSPGDAASVRGDLEAIVATSLRKDPNARYRSVAALIADLEAWLDFRPVSVRRDDWRHRSGLWLRRHAVPAALGTGVALALAFGLVATTWQWQRAERAAHESDAVTGYLTRMLASANPDAHAGEWPTVVQWLDRSRTTLLDEFHDDPDIALRLLGTMATTYTALNRYDLAIPLARQWVELSARLHGEDDVRTIDGRLVTARIYNPIGPWERVIEQLEPERARVARLFGAESDRMLDVLHGLLIGYTHLGEFERAEQALAEAGAITARRFAADDFERVFHHNYEALLYASEGRLHDALAALRLTDAQQRNPPAQLLRFALVLRRSVLEVQIGLADYDRIEERFDAIRREADHLLGSGNALSANLPPQLARYHTDRGEYRRALADRETASATARVGLPAWMQTAAAAQLVLARALATAAAPEALLREAHATADRIDAERDDLGSLCSEAWLAVARSALLLDDAALAARAIAQLRSSPSLHLDRDRFLASRIDQVDGELARAMGDLPRSKRLLARRLAQLERTDHAVPATWTAHLDYAYTLALLHDPDAADALARARRERPPQMPIDTPMDRIERKVTALVATGAAAGPSGLGARRGDGARPLGGMF